MNRDFPFLDSNVIVRDMADVLLGKELGSGISRSVYECKIDRSLVIKIEECSGSFENVKEWENWQIFEESKDVARWFAPCVSISSCGTVLVQKKVEPPRRKDFPEKIPGFLTDLKYENFGIFKGKLVCFDYATVIIGEYKKGMRKAHWWSVDD